MERVTIAAVRQAQPGWFSKENQQFMNDVRYWVRRGQKTGEFYLVRSTYGFTDMFGRENRRLHYRVNEIEQGPAAKRAGRHLKIGKLVDTVFADEQAVKDWLWEH